MYAEHFHENEWTELHTEAEADELRRRLVDECNTDPAHVAYADHMPLEQLVSPVAEPATVSAATAAAYGNLLDPAWYCEMIARAADALDLQKTQEDARY